MDVPGITRFLEKGEKMTEENLKRKRRKYQRAALILFIPAIISTLVLFFWYVLGPQSGMEALAIIIPWFVALIVHTAVTIPVLIFAYKSRAHLQLSGIYVYFIIFWGFHISYYVMMSGMDVAAKKKLHEFQKPAETHLVQLINEMNANRIAGQSPDPVLVKKAEELIKAGVDVNYIPPGTHFPMICEAARINSPRLIKLMIAQGADVEGGVHPSASPLIRAVRQEHSEVAAVLLASGADPDHPGYNPYTPLLVAVKQQDIRTVSVLLDFGAMPDFHPKSGIPALQLAAGNGDVKIMSLLLNAGADPNLVSFGWSTAMIRSVQKGCIDCVEELLRAGGRVLGRTPDRKGVLLLAHSMGLDEVLSLFKESLHIENPGDRFGKDTFNDLLALARNQDWEGFELFLEAGVPPNIQNKDQKTLLQLIASRNYEKPLLSESAELAVAKMLLKNGADPDIKDTHGRSALMAAIQSGAILMAYHLIDCGADVNQLSDKNYSGLYYAVHKNDVFLVKELLQAGADPNARTSLGMNSSSVLDDAVKKGNIEIVRYLLEYGAIPDITQASGANMIRRAVDALDILSLLLEHGLDLDRKDAFNRYPISYTLDKNHVKAFEIIILSGSPLYLEDWKGQQPLYFCAENGYADIIRNVLNRNDIQAIDKTYLRNSLRRAIRHGRIQAVKAFLDNGVRLEYASEIDTLLHYAKPPDNDSDALRKIRVLYEKVIR